MPIAEKHNAEKNADCREYRKVEYRTTREEQTTTNSIIDAKVPRVYNNIVTYLSIHGPSRQR